MASYPTSPSTLTTLDVTQPAATEDAAKLADALRQVKSILVDVMRVSHNDDGSLKALQAIANNAITTVMLAASVVTGDKIANTAITLAKMANLSVGTAQLLNQCVTSGILADGSVVAAKLAALCVNTSNLALKCVSSAILSNSASDDTVRAVSTDHIKDSAITASKIQAGTITPDRLSNVGQAKFLVGDGSGVVALPITGVITATVIAGVLTFSFNGVGQGVGVALFNQPVVGSASGGQTANFDQTWVARPNGASAAPWTKVADPSSLVNLDGDGQTFVILKAGTYTLRGFAMGYMCGTHVCRWHCMDNDQVPVHGSPAWTSIPGSASIGPTQTPSTFYGAFTAGVNQRYRLEHLAIALNTQGLGVGVPSSGNNVTSILAQVEITLVNLT